MLTCGKSQSLFILFTLITSKTLARAPQHDVSNSSLSRVRRQGPVDPPLWPGPPGELNIPIPTNIAVFGGNSQMLDSCPRDEIIMEDGSCQQLLMQGNCMLDQYVLLNPETNMGYCADRLCPLDRVFVFSTQLCHDPKEQGLCPSGRELYVSSYGTPVCSCPDGTYEGDDDLDDDVCEPILGKILNCPAGQVFWFRDLNLGPECLPDPCNGQNLNRGPEELPFLPSLINGRCFQMGSSAGVCPTNTWYGLDLTSLKGVCATLDEFGYNVFNSSTLDVLINNLGSPITDGDLAVTILSSGQQQQSGQQILSSGQQQLGQTGQQFIGGNQPAIIQNQIDNNIITSTIASQGAFPITQNINNNNQLATIPLNQQQSQSNVNKDPIQTINQIQKQIGDLQQQLQMLEQSLQTNNNQQQSNANQRQSQSQTIAIPNHTFPTVNTARTTSTNPISNTNSVIQSPTIIKAKLEAHFTTSSSPSTVTIHQNSEGTTNFIRQSSVTLPSQRVISKQNIASRNNQHIQGNEQNHRNSNVQISVQPMDFVQIQHQENQQVNPTEFVGGNGGVQQNIGLQNQNSGLQQQNGGSQQNGRFNSMESDEHYGGGFFQQQQGLGRRKKRSARNRPNRLSSRPSRLGTRRRRSPLPHASPNNVFESRLLGCRGGAARDINAKCRNVILPSRTPKRPVRAAPPIKPKVPCAGSFNIFRRCVTSSASAQSSVNSFALG